MAAGEIAHGVLVARSPYLVSYHPDFLDAKILRQSKRSACRLQRLEIRLPDDEERIDVARRPTAQMLEPGLEVHDRRPRCLGDETIQHATHGGVSPAESARAAVIRLAHDEERQVISDWHAEAVDEIL